MELLQYPGLCQQFFSLLNFVVEVYPGKVADLDPSLFASLMQCIDFGMRHVQAEIARFSLQVMMYR